MDLQDSFERLENNYDALNNQQDKIRFSRFEQSQFKNRNSKSPRMKKLIASTDMNKLPKRSLREEFKAADITHAASFSKDGNESPFRGPGDYILPDLVGKKKADARQQNEPIYSFGLKLNTKAVPSSKHIQDYLLTESPGVGTYKPEAVNPKKQTPSFSWGSEKRF